MISARSDITGLVLAGGRGSRMGGVDKGLQMYRGRPLTEHALERLRPQVSKLMVNANRNLETYRTLSVPVWPDEVPDYPGPLAGMLAGLRRCETGLLVTVPCDTPNFPHDLVERLAQGLQAEAADIAVAYTRNLEGHTPEGHRREGRAAEGKGRTAEGLFPQPVFCLMRTSLKDALAAFIEAGERKTGFFARGQRNARVIFDDAAAFSNINTLTELEQSQRPSS
ncbi:MAG TPA: molybdenum cofactor guanylyltransferase MobA [Steroidobacteraceae bacterium]|jgi:molybdopterin-guanine dinucleotide biosynthesis protein A|nr:molybdenum cofactor guanylyltransferase MobA [Steroidobacteraceae bacterium]